jgi:hypothetical protein
MSEKQMNVSLVAIEKGKKEKKIILKYGDKIIVSESNFHENMDKLAQLINSQSTYSTYEYLQVNHVQLHLNYSNLHSTKVI